MKPSGLKPKAQTLPQRGGQLAQGDLTSARKLAKPRTIGTLSEELMTRPTVDIIKGLKSFFDINNLLGIKSTTDSPEEKAKKQQIHQRFNQLTEEEKAYVQQKYRGEMQKKQQQEVEAEQIKKQQEEQKDMQVTAPPSGPQKGPVGLSGSRKSRAIQQLKNERTKIGSLQGVS